MIKQLLAGIVSPLSKAYTSRNDRRMSENLAKTKLQENRQQGEQKRELTDAEWEALAKAEEGKTWKDEYLTVVMTSPFVIILVGAIYAAFTGNHALLDSVKTAVVALSEMGVDLGFLMEAVVLSGVGLKIWRSV
tara:strand:+ start:253 stop:654 length:402 start_codon:yes stop_codon:yes gene_type:complete